MRGAALVSVLLAHPAAAAKKAASPPAASEGTPLPVHAPSTAPITLHLIETRFAELDAKTESMRAKFRQSVRMGDSDVTHTIEGEVRFKKPSLMRLTHVLPAPQTVVSDGRFLWVHREETNQVVKTRLEQWRRSEPLAQNMVNFGRTAELLTRYDASISTVSAPGPDGHRVVSLLIKPKASERGEGGKDYQLLLKVSTRDFFPADAALTVGGATVRSVFTDARLNPDFPPETFRFAPPAGADVFETPQDKK